MRFRITTIAYVFSLLAAAIAVFGGLGVLIAGGIVAFWYWTFSASRPPKLVEVLVVIAIVGLLMGLLLPAIQLGCYANRTAYCVNNLHQIALAILSYQSNSHGRLPPATERDAQGQAMHSWRTKILRHLDMKTIDETYHWNEPWNSKNNVAATAFRLDVFACPSDPSVSPNTPQTNYFAVTGPESAWSAEPRLLPSKISDGPDQTILLIEVVGKNIAWAEPRDLTFDEALELLSSPSKSEMPHMDYNGAGENSAGFFDKGYRGTVPMLNVAFANGQVRSLALPLSRELARALLTANGDDRIDLRELDSVTLPQLDYGKIYVFAVFVFLALLPGYRLWTRRRSSRVSGT